MKTPSKEQRYFDLLKRISKSDSLEWLQKNCEKVYGVGYHEALEAAYENIQTISVVGLMGKRRPKS